MIPNLGTAALLQLKKAWADLISKSRSYSTQTKMFWSESDLSMQLCYSFLNFSKGLFEIHAGVKLESAKGTWGEPLLSNMKRPLLEIWKFGDKKNYIDIVVNRTFDERTPLPADPFLLCAELKYWYCNSMDTEELLKELDGDLERLVILKGKNVTENVACLILNMEYEKDSSFIQKVENKLTAFQSKGVEIEICHDVS